MREFWCNFLKQNNTKYKVRDDFCTCNFCSICFYVKYGTCTYGPKGRGLEGPCVARASYLWMHVT
jgi:hypothetical protein